MSMLWPGFLALLILVPFSIAAYIWLLRRRKRYAVRYSSLSLVRAAIPKQSWVRRHLPFALFMLAIVSLILALVRPIHILSIPTEQTSIILAIDVSMSMRQNDIQPSRLQAAQAAAMSFIQRQKATAQIGIVAFSGYAELIQPPTTDQEALQIAIESLTTGRATAIGSGILQSIDAIADIDKNVMPSIAGTTPSNGQQPAPVVKGAYVPEIIVLLTDGVSNAGPKPLDAGQQAAERGVRVYTIGFGTEQGSPDMFRDPRQSGRNRGQFGTNPVPGGGNQSFGRFRRGIDEDTLKQIAELTGGHYYVASSAGELQKVFQDLPTSLITKHEVMELSVIFAALGAFLAAIAIGLSLLWRPLG